MYILYSTDTGRNSSSNTLPNASISGGQTVYKVSSLIAFNLTLVNRSKEHLPHPF